MILCYIKRKRLFGRFSFSNNSLYDLRFWHKSIIIIYIYMYILYFHVLSSWHAELETRALKLSHRFDDFFSSRFRCTVNNTMKISDRIYSRVYYRGFQRKWYYTSIQTLYGLFPRRSTQYRKIDPAVWKANVKSFSRVPFKTLSKLLFYGKNYFFTVFCLRDFFLIFSNDNRYLRHGTATDRWFFFWKSRRSECYCCIDRSRDVRSFNVCSVQSGKFEVWASTTQNVQSLLRTQNERISLHRLRDKMSNDKFPPSPK